MFGETSVNSFGEDERLSNPMATSADRDDSSAGFDQRCALRARRRPIWRWTGRRSNSWCSVHRCSVRSGATEHCVLCTQKILNKNCQRGCSLRTSNARTRPRPTHPPTCILWGVRRFWGLLDDAVDWTELECVWASGPLGLV